MKKYLPFFIGLSVLFNLLFACSIFMNGFYLLNYVNPFGKTRLDNEINSVEEILMLNTEMLERSLDDRKYLMKRVLDKSNSRRRKIYLSHEEQINNHFDRIITRLRSENFLTEKDLKLELDQLKSYSNMMMKTYFGSFQQDIMLTDNEIKNLLARVSRTIDTRFELIFIPKFMKESLINTITLLKVTLSDQMTAIFGSRGCRLNYVFPVVSMTNSYIKVGEPVELFMGFHSNYGFNSQDMIVKVNGIKIEVDKPYLLTNSAVVGTHTVKIEVVIVNPVTGEVRKQVSEWHYMVE